MRYLAIVLSVLMVAACTSDFQRQGYKAVEADCKLRGYTPSTPDYRNCIKVGKHNVDVVDMQHRLLLMQQWGQAGAAFTPQPTSQLPAPTVANPQTFCYPTEHGYTYCQ